MTTQTREDLIAECKAMHNDIGLYGDTEICRLVGFGEDERDWYYVLQTLRGKRYYGSAVGPFESLRTIYPRYEHLETLFILNGCPPLAEFVMWAAAERDEALP